MNNLVITIGREFGSGGKYIGEKLAERLGIKFYDKELLKRVSEENHIDMQLLERADEKQKQSFWYTLAMASFSYTDSVNTLTELPSNEIYFADQAKVMEEIANTESCVIIGRCSNFILRNNPNAIHIFVYASDFNFKVNRKMKYGDLTQKEATHLIHKTDKERAAYYSYYTDEDWGDKKGYDLCIDTSKIGVDKTVDLIIDYISKRKEQ